jgi:hypothetical protein
MTEEAWQQAMNEHFYDAKTDLEEILASLPRIQEAAKDRALDDITNDKKNALFYEYYVRLHVNHEVRNWLRYMLTQTYMEDKFIYEMTEKQRKG